MLGIKHTPEDVTAWIETVLRLTNWSPSKLAREAGIAPSAINRFIAALLD